MGFGKTFILSLVTLVGLTFGGWVLYLALSGTIGQIGTALSSLSGIADAFFFPKILYPYPGGVFAGLVTVLFSGAITAEAITLFIFLIITPLLAAVVAGVVGESKVEVFGAWFLVIGVCMGTALTLILLGPGLTPEGIVNFILGAVVHGLVYGCVALLVAGSESF